MFGDDFIDELMPATSAFISDGIDLSVTSVTPTLTHEGSHVVSPIVLPPVGPTRAGRSPVIGTVGVPNTGQIASGPPTAIDDIAKKMGMTTMQLGIFALMLGGAGYLIATRKGKRR